MAQVQLGLTADEFFRLTPRQLHLLMDRHRERVEHAEWLGGLLCATVANWSMGAPKKPLTASDFLPSLRKYKPKPKRINRRKVNDDIRAFLNARYDEQQKKAAS